MTRPHRRIHGVNLGNWLVLERWMCPDDSPFSGTDAPDEYGLLLELGRDELERRLERHRREYVGAHTFEWLTRAGIGLVRIPVPYWVFGTAHHSPCVEYLDRAFDWAQTSGLRVLIDLHTVPGGQNASDNGGVCGLCTWHVRPDKVGQALDTLELLAQRYADHPALFGIEPLNEPANEAVFSSNAARYSQRYPDRVGASSAVPRAFLERFYTDVYDRLRPVLPDSAAIVLHDRFDPLESWEDFMPSKTHVNVWLDTHRYLVFSEHLLSGNTAFTQLCSHIRLLLRWRRQISRAGRHHRVLVGEWSLASKNKLANHQSWLAKAQLCAWKRASASCFWSLRAAPDDPGNWSFERAREIGFL